MFFILMLGLYTRNDIFAFFKAVEQDKVRQLAIY